MSFIPASDSVNVLNASGSTVNPATEESIILLKRMVKLLESNATVDASNRQRIITEAGSVSTVSIAATQTLATLTSITNAVPVGNVATMGGVDPRWKFMELARISYSNVVRSRLSFT